MLVSADKDILYTVEFDEEEKDEKTPINPIIRVHLNTPEKVVSLKAFFSDVPKLAKVY